MTEPIPDGTPVDMSQVRLGPRYGAEDMYRDMGIERGTPPEMPFVDTVREVRVEIGEGQTRRWGEAEIREALKDHWPYAAGDEDEGYSVYCNCEQWTGFDLEHVLDVLKGDMR